LYTEIIDLCIDEDDVGRGFGFKKIVLTGEKWMEGVNK